MIVLTKNQSVPKKYPSIVRAIEDASDIGKVLAHSLFKSGIVNLDSVSVYDDSNYTITHEITERDPSDPESVETLRVMLKYVGATPMVLAFEKENEYETIMGKVYGEQFQSYHKGMDETNLVAADEVNRISLPLDLFYHQNVDGYSSNLYSALYINGTPQKISRTLPIQSVNDPESGADAHMLVGFERISGGTVYPEPKNTLGQFSEAPITGALLSTWLEFFTTRDAETNEGFFTLHFSNFRLNSTPRMLVVEVTDPANGSISYLHVPKDVADQATDLYYRVDDQDPSKVFIPQQYFIDLAGEVNLKFYFVTPVEEVDPFVSGASLSKRYQLPFSNILPPTATTDFKILLHNTATGNIVDVTNLNVSMLGNAYRINYENSNLELFSVVPGLINENVNVYIANIEYAPPLTLDYVGDMANVVSTYGVRGTTFDGPSGRNNDRDMPRNFALYVYVSETPIDFSSYTNSQSRLLTVPQLKESDIRFLLKPLEPHSLEYDEYGFLIDSNGNHIKDEGGNSIDHAHLVSDTGYIYLRVGTVVYEPTKSAYELRGSEGVTFTSPFDSLMELAKKITVIRDPSNSVRYEKISTSASHRHTFIVSFVPPFGDMQVAIYGWMANITARAGGVVRDFSAEMYYFEEHGAVRSLISEITQRSSSPAYFQHVPGDYETNPFFVTSVSGPIGRKYVAIEVNVVGEPQDTTFEVEVDIEMYVRMSRTG